LNRDEIAGGIVIFLFGAVTTLLSLRMPIGTFRTSGTGMFPLFLGILLMFLSCLFLLKLFYKTKKTTVSSTSVAEVRGSPIQLILFFGTMVLTTAFFNQLGYPLSSFLLMVALLRILGVNRWRLNLPLSFITAVVCYFLFVRWLQIPLPKGLIGI
jgi:hypothetical protein